MLHIYKNITKPVTVSGVSTCRYFELPKTYTNNPGESHEEYELIYVDKGAFVYKAGNSSGLLHQGEILFIGSGTFHSTVCNGKSSANVFVATFGSYSPVLEEFGESHVARLSVWQQSVISELISTGVKVFDISSKDCALLTKNNYKKQIFVNYLEILIASMLNTKQPTDENKRIFRKKNFSDNPLITAIEDYITENLYKNRSLDDISAAVGYSKCYICRHFKENTGYTVNDWYQCAKIEEAKHLILETDLAFEEISASLGFSNPQYFSRVFRKMTGMSPGFFRRKVFKGSLISAKKPLTVSNITPDMLTTKSTRKSNLR